MADNGVQVVFDIQDKVPKSTILPRNLAELVGGKGTINVRSTRCSHVWPLQ
jgi:hypothetical protein